MSQYTILTYCSRNYEPALRWVLPSWLRNEVSRILVAADFPLVPPDDRVTVYPYAFAESDDWVLNTSRKAEVAARFFPTQGKVAFLDLDCWIQGDIRSVFGPQGTISVTRYWSLERGTNETITSGAWFANSDCRVWELLKLWKHQTDKRYNEHATASQVTTEQYVFTDLCRQAFSTGSPCHIQTVPEQIFNFEHSDAQEMERRAGIYKPTVIHFKGQRWKDKGFVSRVLSAARR